MERNCKPGAERMMVFQHYSTTVANCAWEYPVGGGWSAENANRAEKISIVNEHLANLTAAADKYPDDSGDETAGGHC